MLQGVSAALWTIVGLALSAVGVVLLFIFGMPFEVPRAGPALLIRQANAQEKRREARFRVLGGVGLVAIILSLVCQTIGALGASGKSPQQAFPLKSRVANREKIATADATPFPVAIKQGAPEDRLAISSIAVSVAAATGTIALAVITVLLARRAERLRFTDRAIIQTVEPQMVEALNSLQGGGKGGERARVAELFRTVDLSVPVDERPEPGRSFMVAVGRYDNLFDRISAYTEANLIDERLYFSQYAVLIIEVYFLLKDHVWESVKIAARPRITKLATRAFLYYAEHDDVPWVGDDVLSFYEAKARYFYPSAKTERALLRIRSIRNDVWRRVYGQEDGA